MLIRFAIVDKCTLLKHPNTALCQFPALIGSIEAYLKPTDTSSSFCLIGISSLVPLWLPCIRQAKDSFSQRQKLPFHLPVKGEIAKKNFVIQFNTLRAARNEYQKHFQAQDC